MPVSVFDLFTVGIGPSSSHTVGPMRAALRFCQALRDSGDLAATAMIRAELFGSLGATGHGHGSVNAVVLGLLGYAPETIDPDTAGERAEQVRSSGRLPLPGSPGIAFSPDADIVLHRRRSLPAHPNGMIFTARDAGGQVLAARTYYSVGGGFVTGEETQAPATLAVAPPYPFTTGQQLLDICARTRLPVSEVMRANERTWRREEEITAGLLGLWGVMQECVARGCSRDGTLPGGLRVRRRARRLHETLLAAGTSAADDPLRAVEWLNLWALAVNEENASGGRVVTAPTNGAAGIIPAVLHYYARFVPGAGDAGIQQFLLTAAAVGIIIKEGASISGAEAGCQGEVGSACAMAAAGLAEVLGGTPQQAENAAEIGMEHNLGLTCDPVGGLVQIPCIERNAIAAVKAVNAARLALHGDGIHTVTLDKAVKTMRETGADMKTKYKETARGGLAVNVIEC